MDYEVMTFLEPVICPIYDDPVVSCISPFPCADIMIIDFKMPRMNGLELIRQQFQRGCKLNIRNKAVMSGYLDDEIQMKISLMGCTIFNKPFSLSELSPWLNECENRINTSEPLAIKRKESRHTAGISISYITDSANNVSDGVVTNISESGLCMKIHAPLEKEQVIRINTELPNSCQMAAVKWVQEIGNGLYMAGLHRN